LKLRKRKDKKKPIKRLLETKASGKNIFQGRKLTKRD